MRLILITIAALVAFAGNSLLNRAALAETEITPAAFTAIRLLSGAVFLAVLVGLGSDAGKRIRDGSWLGAIALAAYAVAFSFAYVTLDAGVGALALFGGVQITMFGGVLLRGGRPGFSRWIGSALGMLGLGVLFLPGASAPDPAGLALMLVAAFAWGVYSLLGQGVADPLASTAGNFLRTFPLAAILAIPMFWTHAPFGGVVLAILSGALTSGLGYALWYTALRDLDQSLAAILQLTVPIIAVAGGVLFLGESVTITLVLAAILVSAGVMLSLPKRA